MQQFPFSPQTNLGYKLLDSMTKSTQSWEWFCVCRQPVRLCELSPVLIVTMGLLMTGVPRLVPVNVEVKGSASNHIQALSVLLKQLTKHRAINPLTKTLMLTPATSRFTTSPCRLRCNVCRVVSTKGKGSCLVRAQDLLHRTPINS